jgi:glycosyltransferase involved in cell wall biosynthesis
MKKVLIVCAAYPDQHFRANHIFIQDQAEVLARKFDVLVYIAEVPGLCDYFKVFKGQKSGSHNDVTLYHRRCFYHPRLPTFLFSSGYFNEFRKGFERILRSWGKPDIIHAHVAFPAGWASVNLAQEYRIPVILTEHTGPFSALLTTAGRRLRVHEALRRALRVVAVSPSLSEQMQAFYPEITIDIIGNVIRTDYFNRQPEISTQKIRKFLTVCFLQRAKGVDYLLEAAAILRAQGLHKFELIIGGSGEEYKNLKYMAARLGLSSCCRFLGMLTRSQVRDELQSADVFILPSLAETFGVVLGEAMACGKPVISTRCGGPEFVVTPETGILVNPGDSKTLAEAMQGFLTGRREFNSEVIRESVCRRFGEKAFISSITNLYQNVWQSSN